MPTARAISTPDDDVADAPDWGFSDLSPTARWLLGHGLPTTHRPPSTNLSDDEWARLLDSSRTHRLTGHLVGAVASGDLPVSDQQRAATATLELELAAVRSRYDEVCRPALDALADAGIEHRLLKGSALPWVDYPDPQLRPTADLDVLVPSRHLHRAVDRLTALGGTIVNPEPSVGYATQVFKGLTVRLESGLEVDLHRILAWGPFGVRVPECDLWSPGRTFDLLGGTATTLDVERTLVHVSGHLLLLGAFRASEVRDVAQLLSAPMLDPERAIDVARRWGQEAILATAVLMATREIGLLPMANPLYDWAVRHPIGRRDRLWLRMEQPNDPLHGLEQAAVFVELGGLTARRTQLRALLRPLPGTDPSLRSRVTRLTTRR